MSCCLIHCGATEKTKLDNELELGKVCLSSVGGFLSTLGQRVSLGLTMGSHIIECVTREPLTLWWP